MAVHSLVKLPHSNFGAAIKGALIVLCILGSTVLVARTRRGEVASTSGTKCRAKLNHVVLEANGYPSPRENPTVYPGNRPPQAYLLEGNKVRLIDFTDPEDVDSGHVCLDDGTVVGLDARLRQLGATPLQDRIAVIGYGSNPNPGQILKKWSDARRCKDDRQPGSDRVQDIVPVLKGTLEDIDVVIEQFTRYGTVYAGILQSSQTKGRRTEAWLTLLDPLQFRIMNVSEGIYDDPPTYKLAVFPGYRIDGFHQTISPLGYAGNSRIFTSRKHKSPIVFKSVESKGGHRLPQYDALGAMKLIFREGNLGEKVFPIAGVKTVPGLMHWINDEWNRDPEQREHCKVNRSERYVEVSGIIQAYIKNCSSMEFNLADEKAKEGLLIPTDRADIAASDYALHSLLQKAQADPH